MPDDFTDDELANASGSVLRQKLEQALKENRTLKGDVASLRAERLISEKGLSLIKPEDLQGVDPDELEVKALALHKEREDQQLDGIRTVFRRKGLDGDDLEKAVADFVGPEAEHDEALGRIRSTSSLAGAPVKLVNPENLHGEDLLKFAFGALK